MTYRCINGHERDYFPPWGLEDDSQICWECGHTMEPVKQIDEEATKKAIESGCDTLILK